MLFIEDEVGAQPHPFRPPLGFPQVQLIVPIRASKFSPHTPEAIFSVQQELPNQCSRQPNPEILGI